MSIKKIIDMATENNPLAMKAAFEEEIEKRVSSAIAEKFVKAAKNEEEEKDCPHCEGMGYHEDEDGNKEECPKCEGTGKLKAESDDDDDDDEDEDQADEAILTKAAQREKDAKKAAKK
jgi:acetyl-CoA carboxylase beta subunit